MKTWAPFSLVVIVDFNFNDSGFIALMAILIAVVGGSLTNLRSPPPPPFNKRLH